MPSSARPGSTSSCCWIAGRRVERSSSSTAARGSPSRTQYGPYGSDGRCTFETATNRPVATSASTYAPFAPGGSTSGKREISWSRGSQYHASISAITHSFAVPSWKPMMSGSAAWIVETTCPIVSGHPAGSVHHCPVSRFHSSPP